MRRQRPRYIQLMSGHAAPDLHRIERQHEDDEPASRDDDFSRETMARLDAAGYRAALQCLVGTDADTGRGSAAVAQADPSAAQPGGDVVPPLAA
ncbi:DUF3734 domain-containing protein [Pseudorhodoferax sp. LjRoot39]|uniref:DUF3734 domain-containing protein n=1 Tax=Pseudorhodoferax sp. LjRoot39 TaxID=3342328 RepID=UPI003ECCA6CD